jgi:hypothetical protein
MFSIRAGTSPVQERIRFIRDHQSGMYEMTELCERYGISRKTGYKWLERFEEMGASGLDIREPRGRARVRWEICCGAKAWCSPDAGFEIAPPHPGYIPLRPRAPNELWTVLALQLLTGTDGHGVRPVFGRVFREAGLPKALQTDDAWCINFCNTELGRYDRRQHRFMARSNRGGPGSFASRTPD